MDNVKYVIVTGGRGFVGHNLIGYLLENTDYNIISLDADLTGVERKKYESGRVRYIGTELRFKDSSSTAEGIRYMINAYKGKLKAIFHFGEYSRVVPSKNNIDTVIESNVHLTIEIIKLCMQNNIELIYSASSTRFNIDGEIDHETCNKLPYPYFKSMMVDTIKRFGEWYPSFKYKIVYFYNVYGPTQVEEGEYATVLGIWEKAYREGNPITVIGDGTQTRDFTHIDDIVRGVGLAFTKGADKHEYHLGTGKDYSIKELAELFKTDIKYLPKIVTERVNGKAPLDNLARTELKWEPKNDIKKYINNIVTTSKK